MTKRKYKSHKNKRNFGIVFLIALVVILLVSAGVAYASVSPFVNVKEEVFKFFGNISSELAKQNISSKFDIKLTDIGFRSSNNLFGPDILYVSGDKLLFRVDVTPKDSFTGKPFAENTLGNKDIGYKTIVESRPLIYLILLSRDGYYFGATGPLIWTPEELKLPDPSERDYYKVQNIEDRRVKSVVIGASSSDKAVVSLLQDGNKLIEELQKEQWKEFIKGDWLLGNVSSKEADDKYIRGKFESLFNKYFKLEIVDKERFREFEKLNN